MKPGRAIVRCDNRQYVYLQEWVDCTSVRHILTSDRETGEFMVLFDYGDGREWRQCPDWPVPR